MKINLTSRTEKWTLYPTNESSNIFFSRCTPRQVHLAQDCDKRIASRKKAVVCQASLKKRRKGPRAFFFIREPFVLRTGQQAKRNGTTGDYRAVTFELKSWETRRNDPIRRDRRSGSIADNFVNMIGDEWQWVILHTIIVSCRDGRDDRPQHRIVHFAAFNCRYLPLRSR